MGCPFSRSSSPPNSLSTNGVLRQGLHSQGRRCDRSARAGERLRDSRKEGRSIGWLLPVSRREDGELWRSREEENLQVLRVWSWWRCHQVPAADREYQLPRGGASALREAWSAHA